MESPLTAPANAPTGSPDEALLGLDPFSRLTLTNRKNFGTVLVTLAAVLLVLVIVLFARSYSEFTPSPKDKQDESKSGAKETKSLDDLADDTALRGEKYSWGSSKFALSAALVCLGFAASGVWLLVQPRPAEPRQAAREARTITFATAVSLGVGLAVLGAWLFIAWFEILSKGLAGNMDDRAELWRPLLAVLFVVLGLGLILVGVIPARAEERNSTFFRRLAYGINSFFLFVLLVVVLVVVNIITMTKLPNQLDATERGIYTLAPATKNHLSGLEQDIAIYMFLPEEGRRGGLPASMIRDMKRVLLAFRDANPGRVQVRDLSPTLDRREIERLREKYPAFKNAQPGVLLVSQEKEGRHTFVSEDDLITLQQVSQTDMQIIPQAEARIIREVLFLTDSNATPVIYFTQGHGELSIDRPSELHGSDSNRLGVRYGLKLKERLELDRCTVRPLRFALDDPSPKIPDDATAVIVADPSEAISSSVINALRVYLAGHSKNAKHIGKLIVITGARPSPSATDRKVLSTGLETLLNEFGILLRPGVLYSKSTNEMPPNEYFVQVNEHLLATDSLGLTQGTPLRVTDAQIVMTAPRPQEQEPPVFPLLYTSETRLNWYEDRVPEQPRTAEAEFFAQFLKGNQETTKKALFKFDSRTRSVQILPIPVAVIAKDRETSSNRIVVFGFGKPFEDSAGAGTEFPTLLARSVNWLRERPPIADIDPKEYGRYKPSPTMNWNTVFFLPVGLVTLFIAALGAAVWVVRRQ